MARMYKGGPLKRTYHVTPNTMNKRIKRIEHQVYRNRPEMKTITFNSEPSLADNSLVNILLTNIANGSDINERIGDKIRVYRVELRGWTDVTLDNYLIQCKTTTVPTVANFTTSGGAYIVDSDNTSRFTEWKHYRNQHVTGGTTPIKMSHSFKGGILVKYNGPLSTNGVDNQLVFTILNRSGATRQANFTCRVWYTDA